MSKGKYERKFREELENLGFLVIRGAGSLGIDLVAHYPGDEPIYIEHKATEQEKFNWSDKAEQFEELNEISLLGFNVVTVVRWKKKTELHGTSELEKNFVFPFNEVDGLESRRTIEDYQARKYPVLPFGEGIDSKTFLDNFTDKK